MNPHQVACGMHEPIPGKVAVVLHGGVECMNPHQVAIVAYLMAFPSLASQPFEEGSGQTRIAELVLHSQQFFNYCVVLVPI